MKHTAFALAALLLASCTSAAERAETVWTPDLGNGQFKNPIFWGDWPDSEVIRVGDTFYFISTSMHYVPGCPIAKSKDLVNWEMAGYALPRYDEDKRFDMKGGTLYLNGSWASTLRHHNGKFYAGFCTQPAGGGTGHFSMCVADDVKGPWKRTIFPEYLYDPGLFFDDDGKAYVAHGQGDIYITPLADDALSVAGKGVKVIERGAIEGSHLYKIHGKYYLFCPSAGAGEQVCFRSDHIYGPYEKKTVMHDTRKTQYGVHQGGLVQLKNGDWWCLIMEDRGPIGRTTRLEPVTWVDGWPMIGRKTEKGEWIGVDTCKKPDVGATFPIVNPATSDEFDGKELGLQWQWNHNPDDAHWSLTERPGYMRLTAGGALDPKAGGGKTLFYARNTLTQRVQGPACEGTTELDVSGLKDGCVAGLGIFQSPYAFVGVKQEEGKRSIVMENNGKTVATVADFSGKTVWLKAKARERGFKATFEYSLDGKTWTPIGDTLGMGLGLDWTANRFALFNYATSDAGVGGTADFNWFRFAGIQPPEASAQSAYGPSYAADVALYGDPATLREWVSMPYGGGTKDKPLDVWWAVDFFSKPVTVSGVKIIGDPRDIIPLQKNLQIQARQDGVWKTVGELKDATAKDVTITFSAPVTTDALRVFVPAADLPTDGMVRICKFLLVLPDGTVKEIE